MLNKVIGVSKNKKVWCKRRFRRVMIQIALIDSRLPLSKQKGMHQEVLNRQARNYKR